MRATLSLLTVLVLFSSASGPRLLGADAPPLSLTIQPKSEVFVPTTNLVVLTNIVIICQLKNETEKPLKVDVPDYGSDWWLVDGCYGSMSVPAHYGGKPQPVVLKPQESWSFERQLKSSMYNQLSLHFLDGQPVRDLPTFWRRTGESTSKYAFPSNGVYRLQLELIVGGKSGTNVLIRSNEISIKIQ